MLRTVLAASITACALGCGPGPAPTDAGRDAPTGEDASDERPRERVPGATGVTCPPGGTDLTYAGFAAPFFEAYCTRCHSATLGVGERNGAPMGYDYDTHDGVRARAARIDAVAGAGPTRVNVFMPLGDPAPSAPEREALAAWIACGLP